MLKEDVIASIHTMVKTIGKRVQQYYANPVAVEIQSDPEHSPPTIILSEYVTHRFWFFFTRTDQHSLLAVSAEINRGQIDCGLYDMQVYEILKEEAANLVQKLPASVMMLDYTKTNKPLIRKKIA